ncbi:MAG: transcriptional repressor [Alphaproteobacteria bacterium]|nr:transcriptional repressor [Alphaproteobacteria bacterium]
MAKPLPELPINIIQAMKKSGLKVTAARRAVLAALLSANQSDKHDMTPERIYRILKQQKKSISLATIYRALKSFEKEKMVIRHAFHKKFDDQKNHYELNIKQHHDHLINIETGAVIEFTSPDLEQLQEKIVRKLGYSIIDHRLEIYARPLPAKEQKK